MRFKDILLKYDDENFKTFDERTVCSHIKSVSGITQAGMTMEELAEIMAFDFWEDYKDPKTGWGTYFGPMIVKINDGVVTESPSITLVTSDMLSYWWKRANEVVNPILKCRYSGLVWDFTFKVKGEKPNVEIAKTYINAVLQLSEFGYYQVEIWVYTKLEHALSIAVLLNINELIKKCKVCIIDFENKVSIDKMPGTWGKAFELLVFNKKAKLTLEEERAIIDELEAKLERLLSVDDTELIHNIWPAQNTATMLGDYYRKKTMKDDVFRVITRFAIASEKAHIGKSVSEIAANAEELYKIYLRYHLREKAADMLLKLREASAKVPSEMKKIGANLEIPQEKIDEFLSDVTAGSLEESLKRFLFIHIPIKENSTKLLNESAKKAPLSYIFTQQVLDKKGRLLTTIGPLENDFEGHLIKQISLELTIQSVTVRLFVDELINKYGLNTNDVLAMFKECPVIEQDRLKLIEKGLDAYFMRDFVTAIHLLVPQIEESVRNIVEHNGGNVLKEAKGGGSFHLRTFDDILRDNIVAEVLGAELVDYLKILFTDQRGWNIRNNVCHGMCNSEDFDFKTADRVLHALLCLTIVRIVV